jgi:hypothetical protein
MMVIYIVGFSYLLLCCYRGLFVLKINSSIVVCVMLFLGLFLAVPNPVFAQSELLELQWSTTYDNYCEASIIQAVDGGLLIAGAKTIYLPYLSFAKTNSNGEVEWNKTCVTINGTPQVMRSVNSGYYFLLYDGDAGARVLKMDLRGNSEWIKQFDFSTNAAFHREVNDLFVTKDGNFAIVISERGTRSPWQVSLFMGYDADGVLLWEKSIEGVRINVALQSDDGEGYYVAGMQDKQPWFAKLDSNCEIIWSRSYGSLLSSGLSGVRSVIPTSDGGFLLDGYLPSSGDVVDFVVKTDGNGKKLWSRKCDSSIYDVVEVKKGQCLVFSSSGIICVSASGEELWVEPYSKYVEDFMSLTNVTSIRRGVSAFVSGEGNVVVAIPYGVSGHYTSGLWLASFTVDTSSFNGDEGLYRGVLLYGVAVVITVAVFVGFLVYLKKRKQHKYSVTPKDLQY